ncbi:MAG: DPP IV N-terminal domain-containing protein [Pseudomonadota bacterium]
MWKMPILPVAALLLSCCAAPLAQTSPEPTSAMVEQKPLTIERLYASPSLSGPTPSSIKYSPDGKRVTFLKAREEDGSRYDLWQFDVATGEQSMLVDSKLLEPEEVELSEEEKALRERRRIAGRKGIVAYDWGTADTILVPLGGDLHLVTLGAGEPQARQLTETDAFEYDAKVSPGGDYVSFIRDGAVYVIDLATGDEELLTPLAEPDKAIAYGVAEFVAQEEMDRYTGYWWSPDDRYLAYTRVDESTVDIIPRLDIAAEDVTVINQRYPRAGRPNAIVDLFVRDIETGDVTEIDWRRDDWGPATDQYLARVNWLKRDSQTRLVIQRVDRKQKTLEYQPWIADPSSGPSAFVAAEQPMFSEQQENFVNLSSDFAVTEPFVAYSTEASGYRHIVRTASSESPDIVPLTEGDWPIHAIQYFARDGGHFYFTGYMDTPLERHLYRHSTGPGADAYDPVLLTERGRSWAISMAPDGQSFVGTSSSPTQPPQTGLYRSEDGSLITWIEENKLDETHPYAPYLGNHTVPEYGTLTADDGQTLYYSIQLPPDFDAGQSYPALVETYGGPHAQTVNRNWERLSDQFYSRQGYVVFRIDNRGMANRGKAFEDVIYRQMGIPEVRDLLVGVDWLKSQPFIDGDRVGIQGWSYGGYMTMMTILQAPEGTFAAAVAGAPVADWALYDTFYTERYMDTPQDNADGYEKSSVFYHLDRFETELPKLMMIHGMADDNVTFDNTTRLMAELQQRGIVFDLMTYPGQRHGIRGQALGTHLMKSRMAFLERHLK